MHLGDHRIGLEQLPQMHGDAGPGLELFAIFRLQQTNRQVLEALPAGTPGAPCRLLHGEYIHAIDQTLSALSPLMASTSTDALAQSMTPALECHLSDVRQVPERDRKGD